MARQADAIIIGAGVIGAATAFELCKRGYKTLNIDRLPHLFDRVHEHRDLLCAIRNGEAERARDIAAEHVATFESEIRGVL